MTASERLRELDGAIGTLPEDDLHEMGLSEFSDLRAALPLIADVIEAAEYAEQFLHAVMNPLPDGGRTASEAKLDSALTALRDALEGENP